MAYAPDNTSTCAPGAILGRPPFRGLENRLSPRNFCDIYGGTVMLEHASRSPRFSRSCSIHRRASATSIRTGGGASGLWAGLAERLGFPAAGRGLGPSCLGSGGVVSRLCRAAVAWECSFIGNVVSALSSNRPWSGAVRRVFAQMGRSWEKKNFTSEQSNGVGHVGPLCRGDQQR